MNKIPPTCLLCGERSSESQNKVFAVTAPTLTGVEVAVQQEVTVILLLRKVLGLSKPALQRLLQNFGDPSKWGLTLCSPCNRIFIELKFVHDRLTVLHSDYADLAKRLRDILKESLALGASTSSPSSTSLEYRKKNERRRGRRSRGSRSEDRSHQEILPPTAYIRQACFESKGTPLQNQLPASLKILTIPLLNVDDHESVGTPITIKREHVAFNNAGAVVDTITGEDSKNYASATLSNKKNGPSDSNDLRETTRNEESLHSSMSSMNDGDGFDDNDYDDICDQTYNQEDDEKDLDFELKTAKKKKSPLKLSLLVETSKDFDPFSVPEPIKTEIGYRCPVCKRRALSKIISHGHILRTHYNEVKPYPCHLCPSKFKRDAQLRQHLMDDHDGASTPLDDPEELQVGESVDVPSKVTTRTFECDICPKTKYRVLYQSEETLEAHKKRKHLGIAKPFSCKLCNKAFKLQTTLRFHMFTHQRLDQEKKKVVKQHSCLKCNLTFKSIGALKLHLQTKTHSGNYYPYQCELCPKGFFQKSSLDNHHAQEHYQELNLEPFKCSFCESILSSQRALDHHTRIIHTKDTLFRCEPCDLGFMNTQTYKRHIAVVHSGERTYLCSYCPKRFAHKNHFQTHIRTHTGEKPYKCPHCDKAYSDRPTYRRHLETHEQQEYECSFCENKRFKVWHSYRTHMKTHNQNVQKKWRNWQKQDTNAVDTCVGNGNDDKKCEEEPALDESFKSECIDINNQNPSIPVLPNYNE